MSKVAHITAGESGEIYQYHVDGEPTGIVAVSTISASSDSLDIAAICYEWIDSRYGMNQGEVTHDKDSVFVELTD